MAKKKKPLKSDVSEKTNKQRDENSWRNALESLAINDDKWTCMTVMMVETTVEHSKCVSLFNLAAEEGKRRAVYSLSCQKALASVRALSKQPPDKCPLVQGVCHQASKVLNENGGTLPTWLMARVVKYLIYRVKEDSIEKNRKRDELDREIDEEYRIMQTVANPGFDSRSRRANDGGANSKANTRLRKRDEEWRDAVYIDDAPLNGPNLYVVLTGFHDPDLPGELINAGLPLTCVLRIKRSNEEVERPPSNEAVCEESAETRKLQFFESYSVARVDLFNFWTTIDSRLKEPEKYPVYRDIIFVTFFPPEFLDDDEISRKNIYDRVSYVAYDLCDLHRLHGNYLRSMKLEKRIADEGKPTSGREVYEAILDAIPEDCIFVPTILCAMLFQVEANYAKPSVNQSSEKNDAPLSQGVETESKIAPPSAASFIQEKLKGLDLKYSLQDPVTSNDKDSRVLELVSHGDTLSLIDHGFEARQGSANRIPTASEIVAATVRILEHPRISSWEENADLPETKAADYSAHLDKVRGYFDSAVSAEEVGHYLHLLLFDRMIFDGPLAAETSRSVRDNETKIDPSENVGVGRASGTNSRFPAAATSSKRGESLPTLTLGTWVERRSQSEGNIDHGKSMAGTGDCSPLFDLIDPRELLVPGYLYRNNPGKGKRFLPALDDVELLSRQVFVQAAYECLVSFDRLEDYYFEPTDSVLLYFHDGYEVDDVVVEETTSSIRTPVGVREFCQYVVKEEQDWVRREEEAHRLQTMESTGRLMKMTAERYEEKMMFQDEDFIRPGSLKARDLQRAVERSKRDVLETVSSEPKEKKGKRKEAARKSAEKAETSVGDAVAPKGIRSSERVEEKPHQFIGYDLGRLRVQTTNRKTTFFSSDGTLVRVELDEWLYRNTDLRISVSLRGCSLRLLHEIGARETGRLFHLTTKTGIILAFCKLARLHAVNFSERDWRDALFDFRASWPSGLTVEPIAGDGPTNPFYISQSYLSTGRAGSLREVRRKFLRNGTVLKYLDDGTVVVLRPNGVVVTCTAFQPGQRDEKSADGVNLAKGDRPKKEHGTPKHRRRPPTSFKSQLSEVAEEGPADTGQDSTTSDANVSATIELPTAVKVSRYTVVNHDGRQYEVVDDLLVSEHHRLLVRTASDYEVNEKFTRRADGTDMLLNPNGELIVSFPDGTRITTGYRTEKELVMCDWTEEEIHRYFHPERTAEAEGYASTSSSSPKFTEEGSTDRDVDVMTEISISEGFVSVLLTCRMEHKNYATVFYDQSAVNCTLSMPDDLRVSISRRGHYEVSMAAEVNLKIEEDFLTLTGNVCATCGGHSTSTYIFEPAFDSRTIFTTVDLFGAVLEVKDDGSTLHRGSQSGCRKFESDETVFDDGANKGEWSYEETEGTTETDGDAELSEKLIGNADSCDHPGCRESTTGRYRIFAMNRDRTGYEYLHRSVREKLENVAAVGSGASAILYPISRRPEVRRLITFEPVELDSRSKAARLPFPDRPLRPTNFDRRDLPRSTYSIPYDWLFPFGKNGAGIRENSENVPLAADGEPVLPELLKIRILYGLKEPGGNAVIDLQRALGRYWMSLARGERSPIPPIEEDEAGPTDFDKDLRDLSLGVKRNIDAETYRRGLQETSRSERKSVKRAQGESMKFVESLRQRTSKRTELEWYKRCMRNGIVLPYFENIAGTCFLWIKDCVEDVADENIADNRIVSRDL